LRDDDKALIESVYSELDVDLSGFLDISDCTLGSVPTAVLIENGVLNDVDWEPDGPPAEKYPAAVLKAQRRAAAVSRLDNESTVEEKALWLHVHDMAEQASIAQLRSALDASVARIRYLEHVLKHGTPHSSPAAKEDTARTGAHRAAASPQRTPMRSAVEESTKEGHAAGAMTPNPMRTAAEPDIMSDDQLIGDALSILRLSV
jgi:hypothetical protein